MRADLLDLKGTASPPGIHQNRLSSKITLRFYKHQGTAGWKIIPSPKRSCQKPCRVTVCHLSAAVPLALKYAPVSFWMQEMGTGFWPWSFKTYRRPQRLYVELWHFGWQWYFYNPISPIYCFHLSSMYVTPWCSMYGHWQILLASPFYRIWESAHTDSIDSNKSVFGIPLGLLLWDAQPPPKWPNNCTWDATPQLMRFKSNTSPFESRILKKHPKIHSNHNISTVFQLFAFLAVLSYPLPTLHRDACVFAT